MPGPVRKFDPSDWYYLIDGNVKQVWSTQKSRFVLVDDVDYMAWRAVPNTPKNVARAEDLPRGRVPWTVTMAQARKALLTVNITAQNVVDFINANLSDTNNEKANALIDFEFLQLVPRAGSLVLAFQTYKGWTDDQVDNLFILAATL